MGDDRIGSDRVRRPRVWSLRRGYVLLQLSDLWNVAFRGRLYRMLLVRLDQYCLIIVFVVFVDIIDLILYELGLRVRS